MPSLSYRNEILPIAVPKHAKVDIKLDLSSFTEFLYFVPNILSGNLICCFFTNQKSNLFLLESQNITLDALMNRCYIKGATKLQTKVTVSTTKIDKNTANILNSRFLQ